MLKILHSHAPVKGQIIPPDSKWHPAKRRVPTFNLLSAEQFEKTTSHHNPGSKFDIPPPPKSNQFETTNMKFDTVEETSPVEEAAHIMERMLKL